MRKSLLSVLLAGALPLLAVANPNVPVGKHQLHFVENKGQVHDQNYRPRTDIQFSIPGKDMSLFIGDGQLHYQFYRKDKEGFAPGKQMKDMGMKPTPAQYTLYRMDVELVGANPHAPIIKEGEQQYIERHILGNSTPVEVRNASGFNKQGVSVIEAHSFNKITYRNVYPNIDWVIYTKGDQVEYDFVVRPGGNPSDIKIKYSGATSTRLNEAGGIIATTPLGSVTESAPYSYQQDGRSVASSFKLENNILSFNVGQYTGTLTIDPAIAWGTYFGSTGDEEYNAVTYDGVGALYAAGGTNSPAGMATVGAFEEFLVSANDGFVSKFETDGDLVWSTYFGFPAGGDDVFNSIDWDPFNQSVYVIGQTDVNTDLDAVWAQFDVNGGFGGNLVLGVSGADEQGLGIRADANGNVYLSGSTTSLSGMGTTGAVQENSAGGFDGWIAKFDNLLLLAWGTYYGGTGNENLNSAAADATGAVYAAGTTNSTADISTLNLYGGGTFDGYAAKITADGTGWVWGRYFGGSGQDECYASELDAGGNLYMTGAAGSAGIVSGGFQTTYGGGTADAFILKLSSTGGATWSSYYGGSGADYAFGLTLSSTSVYIGGYTESANLNASTGFQTTYGGAGDGFLARATTAGVFTWGTYYGGSGDDAVNSVTTDNTVSYCAGITGSTTGIAVNTLVQATKDVGYDAFISRINECTPPAQPGAISGPNPVCAGSTQTYSIAAVPGATSYTWTLPGGWTGTSTTASISVTVGTTGGTISVVANNTCGAGPAQTLNVTVNPIPTASITPAGPTTFCQGGSVVLNANTGTGFSYAWFQGVTPVGTNSSSYTANASGVYTVQVTSGGCSATSAGVTVTVNPTPNATASSNSPVCTGQTINLNGGSTTPGATYSWLGPLVFGSGLEDPSIPNAVAGNAGVYTLTVTANGCTNTATTTVVVTAGAPATPSAINGDISICAGSTNTYDVTNDPNAASYTWTLPTGWTGASTTNSISATANATSGTISVTATNGCGTSTAATLNITVNPLPIANITQSGNTLTVTGTFTSYQWYDGSGPISGQTGPSFTATASGNYYCVVTDANGCSSPSNTITITVSVNSVTKNAAINLYPNPNTGSFTIEGAFAANDGKANIMIVDVAGRVVYQQQATVINGKIATQVNMNNSLSAGVYTIKVSSDAANAVIPFVKK